MSKCASVVAVSPHALTGEGCFDPFALLIPHPVVACKNNISFLPSRNTKSNQSTVRCKPQESHFTHISIIRNNLDNISSKTLLEQRWQNKYRTLMHSISQFNLEDETGSMRLSTNHSPTTSPNYLTIHNLPRRNRSYVQLENNLRNLFDAPSPLATSPLEDLPSSTPPPTINEPPGYVGGQRIQGGPPRSRTYT